MKNHHHIDRLFRNGISFINLNQFNHAQKTFEEILKLDSRNAEAFHLLGIIAAQLKKPEIAVDYFYKAIRINPKNPAYHCNRGTALQELNRLEEAILSFDKAIGLNSNYALAYNNKGLCLSELKNNEQALICFEKAVNINHQYDEAWFNLGLFHENLNQYQKALDNYDQVVKINAKHGKAFFGKAKMLKKLMRPEEALKAYESVLEIEPDNFEAYSNRGNILVDLNQLPEALLNFDSAIKINPHYHPAYSNKAIAYLRNGNFEAGWALYEKRWETDFFSVQETIQNKPAVTSLIDSADRKILIWAEQGIGDQIMYGSLIKEALNNLHNAIIMMDKRLIPIYERSIPNGNFMDDETPLDQIEFDEQIPIGGLAKFFRNHVNDFPGSKNQYLIADKTETEKIRGILLKNKKILCGISWSSNNDFFGKEKSLQLDDLLPILEVDSIEFVNLQYGDVRHQLETLQLNTGIEIKQYPDIDNFQNLNGLASLIDACDFVVTVSNSTAHLSGALGKPTYLLYAKGAGSLWYWSNIKDGHSLWYPSVAVHQQEKQGDWVQPILNIKNAIAKNHFG